MSKATYIWAASLALFCGMCAWAQWHDSAATNAWNTRRGAGTNVWTNLQAVLATDVWEQNSSTNEIPDWTLSDVELPFRPAQLYSPDDWYYGGYGENMEGTIAGTNGISTRTWTNRYWSKISLLDESDITTNWTHASTNTSFVATNAGIVFTNSITRTYDVLNPTNFTPDYESERSLDLYMALVERNDIFTNSPILVADNHGNQPRGYVDLFHSLNSETLKTIATNLLVGGVDLYGDPIYNFIVPMSDYDTWFSTPQGYDPWRMNGSEDAYWKWNDTDGDGTNDTWQKSCPDHFPVWTPALICASNGLPYAETITTNTADGGTLGWRTGETTSYNATPGATYYATNYTTEYFDFSPSKNYFAVTNDYFPQEYTNSWTIPVWGLMKAKKSQGLTAETTNYWELIAVHNSEYFPETGWRYGLAYATNTNSVVTNVYLEIGKATNDPILSMEYETVFSNNYDAATNATYSEVIKSVDIDAGYTVSDYDIGGLKDVLNDMYVVAGTNAWKEWRGRDASAAQYGPADQQNWNDADWTAAKASNEWWWAHCPTNELGGDIPGMSDFDNGTNTFLFGSLGSPPQAYTESLGTNASFAFSANRVSKYILTNETPYAAQGTVYFRGISSVYSPDAGDEIDIQMAGVTTNYSEYADHSLNATSDYISGWLGDSSNTVPNWCSLATTNDAMHVYGEVDYHSRTLGFKLEMKSILDFSITNGFEYVE